MKLLLTSQGITNPSIAEALTDMVGKSPYDTTIGLIPTARLAEPMSRGSFIHQFLNLWKYGFTLIDIVEPSAAGIDWKTRLSNVDVIFVAGGNTFHLLDQVRKTGLDDWLNKSVSNKVYVGVSAGSILTTPSIDVAGIPPKDRNHVGLKDLASLGWVDFEIEPHCDAARFDVIEKYAAKRPNSVYAIDDQSAIKVVGNKVEVISQGFWKKFK